MSYKICQRTEEKFTVRNNSYIRFNNDGIFIFELAHELAYNMHSYSVILLKVEDCNIYYNIEP